MAVAGAIFAPTVAAITLGMTPQQALPARLGRNAAFDRAGNIFIAVLAGLVGWAFSQRAVFYLVPFFAVLTSLAVLSIPAHAIDHDRARGLVHSPRPRAPREMAGASRTAPTAGPHGSKCIVPFRQCTHAAPAWTETSACSSRRRDRIHLGLHHHRPTRVDPQLGGVIAANLKEEVVYGQDQWCMCR